MEQNKNNSNSNDFLLGVNNSSKNIINNITVVQNNIRNNIKNNIRNNMNMPGMNNNIKEIISSNKNSIEKINIPVSLKNMVYKIINKLEKETVNLDNKIKNFNSEKKKLEEMSSDEIKKLKDIIRKLYNLFFILYKSTDLNKSNTIKLLNQLKNSIKENSTFLNLTNEIIAKDKNLKNFTEEKMEEINKDKQSIFNMIQKNVSLENVEKANNQSANLMPNNRGNNQSANLMPNNTGNNQSVNLMANSRGNNQSANLMANNRGNNQSVNLMANNRPGNLMANNRGNNKSVNLMTNRGNNLSANNLSINLIKNSVNNQTGKINQNIISENLTISTNKNNSTAEKLKKRKFYEKVDEHKLSVNQAKKLLEQRAI